MTYTGVPPNDFTPQIAWYLESPDLLISCNPARLLVRLDPQESEDDSYKDSTHGATP